MIFFRLSRNLKFLDFSSVVKAAVSIMFYFPMWLIIVDEFLFRNPLDPVEQFCICLPWSVGISSWISLAFSFFAGGFYCHRYSNNLEFTCVQSWDFDLFQIITFLKNYFFPKAPSNDQLLVESDGGLSFSSLPLVNGIDFLDFLVYALPILFVSCPSS